MADEVRKASIVVTLDPQLGPGTKALSDALRGLQAQADEITKKLNQIGAFQAKGTTGEGDVTAKTRKQTEAQREQARLQREQLEQERRGEQWRRAAVKVREEEERRAAQERQQRAREEMAAAREQAREQARQQRETAAAARRAEQAQRAATRERVQEERQAAREQARVAREQAAAQRAAAQAAAPYQRALGRIERETTITGDMAQRGLDPRGARGLIRAGVRGETPEQQQALIRAQMRLMEEQTRIEVNGLRMRRDAFREVKAQGGSMIDVQREIKAKSIEAATGNKTLADSFRAMSKEAAMAEAAMGPTRLGALMTNLASRTLRLTAVIVGFTALRGLAQMARDVFSINQEFENARLGIASTTLAAGRFVDVMGQPLPLAQQMTLALAESDQQLKALLADSTRLAVPVSQLVEGYTVAAGFARAAGFQGRDATRAVEGLVVLAQQLNIPMGNLAKTIDNVFSGQRAASVTMARVLGLSEASVKSMVQAGTFRDELLARLEPIVRLQEELGKNTLTGLANNFGNLMRALALNTNTGFIAELKVGLRGVNEQLEALINKRENVLYVNEGLTRLGRIVAGIANAGTAAAIGLTAFAGQLGRVLDELRSADATTLLMLLNPASAAFGMQRLQNRVQQTEQRDQAFIAQKEQLANRIADELNATVEEVTRNPKLKQDIGYVLAKQTQAEGALAMAKQIGRETGGVADIVRLHDALNRYQTAVGADFQATSSTNQESLQRAMDTAARVRADEAEAKVTAARNRASRTKNEADFARLRSSLKELREAKYTEAREEVEKEFPVIRGAAGAEEVLVARRQRLAVKFAKIDYDIQAQEESLQGLRDRGAKASEKAAAKAIKDQLDQIAAERKVEENRGRAAESALKIDKQRGEAAQRILDAKMQLAEVEHQPLRQRLELLKQVQAVEMQTLANEQRQAAERRASAEEMQGLARRELAVPGIDEEQRTRAEAQQIAAETAYNEANQQIEDIASRQQELAIRHHTAVLQLQDDYLYLGDVIKSSLSDAIKGVAFGTGKLSDTFKRTGQTIAGRFIEGFIEKKLDTFDVKLKKNFLEDIPSFGGQSGTLTGSNWIQSAFAALGGTPAATGGGEVGAIGGASLVGGGEMSMMGPAGAAGGAAAGGATGGAAAGAAAAGPAGAALAALAIYSSWAAKDPLKIGSAAGGGWKGGAAAGAAYAGVLGPYYAAIGAGIGALVGAASKIVSQADIQRAALKQSFQQLGIPGPNTGNRGLGDLTGGLGETAGLMFGYANPGVPMRGLPRRTMEALSDSVHRLRLSTEDSLVIVQKFAAQTGLSIDALALKLAYYRGRGKLGDAEFTQNIADALQLLEKIPPALNAAMIAATALGESGAVSLERMKRVLEDVRTSVEKGLTNAFNALVQTSSPTQAAQALGEQFAQAFISRVSERLLQRPEIGGLLTQAAVDAEKAAELMAQGRRAEADAMLRKVSQEFQAGESAFLRIGVPIAAGTRAGARIFGYPFATGVENQTGFGSYATDTITQVRAPLGVPVPAVVHGKEIIMHPNYYGTMVEEIKALRTDVQQLKIVVMPPALPAISLKIGEREFGQMVSESQRETVRSNRYGVSTPNTSLGVSR